MAGKRLFAAALGLLALAWVASRPLRRIDEPPPDSAGPAAEMPGLAIGSGPALPRRAIRVGLTAEPVRSLSLEISGPFRVRQIGNGRVLWQARRLERTKVTATANGFRFGTRSVAATRIEIIPDASPAVWVGDHQYRGSVRLYRRADGRASAVNVVPLEEYIGSVIDSEMPADFPDEARKAQAVVARTYAVYQMRQAPAAATYDVLASTRSQKYLGYKYRDARGRLLAGESEASRRIAAATRGRVCTYRGEPFCTYYCAVCGGATLAGKELFADAAPPVRSVRCDWCREARLYRWTAEVPKARARAGLAQLLGRQARGAEVTSISAVATAPGRLPQFDLRGHGQSYRATGAELRQALGGEGLYSPRFTVSDNGRAWVFSGRGHGHGVGLCQWGARGLARAGRTCEQILAYYYPGSTVSALR